MARHTELKMSQGNINAIKYQFERKQNAANVHRVQRAKYRVDNAWKRYQLKMDDDSYKQLLEDIQIAESQVW